MREVLPMAFGPEDLEHLRRVKRAVHIPVIGSLRPISFIAKSEIAGWPVIGWLAKLQRSG